MPNQEEITQQRNLLAIHRRNLAHYLIQQAAFSGHYTPPSVANGIREARENITRIKDILRCWGQGIEDEPDDNESRTSEYMPGSGHSISRCFVGVPPYPSVFVGRETMLDELRTALGVTSSGSLNRSATARVAISALDGKPGVGKTTVATALAYDVTVLEHFTGGVLWANLGPSPNLDELLNRWADALGVDTTTPPATEARVERVQTALKGQPFLIVLDDVWSWEPAEILRRVSGPGCAHVLTTRDEVIGRRFAPNKLERVDELPEDQAVALLAILCPAAAQVDEVALRKMVRVVGGLPLALRLVGGYLADHITFSSEAKDAFAALAEAEVWLGLQDSAHYLSLSEIVGMSVDALPKDVGVAFATLAAFAPKPASFSLTAAQAIANVDTTVLGTLVRRNLLERATEDRVRIHQVLAAEAVHRAKDIGALADHKQVHARYYLNFIEQDRGAWQEIERELPQIRQAWQWVSGRAGQSDLILAYSRALEPFQSMRGLYEERLNWHGLALDVARASGDRRTEGALLTKIGNTHLALGKPHQALEYFGQALPINQEVRNRFREADTLTSIGRVYGRLGQWQQARQYFEQALSIQQEADGPDDDNISGVATSLASIGTVYHSLGEPRRALNYYERALLIMRDRGDPRGEAAIFTSMGGAYHGLGEPRRALQYFEQALPIYREIGDRLGEAATLASLGSAYGGYRGLGEPRRALQYFEQALPIQREVGDRVGEAATITYIGNAYDGLAEPRRALEFYEQALSIWRDMDAKPGEAGTLTNIGNAYHGLGERQRAIEFYKQALLIHQEVGARDNEAITLSSMATVLAEEGDRRRAVVLLEQAVAITELIEHPDIENYRALLAKLCEERSLEE